jgi:hypothetical protein
LIDPISAVVAPIAHGVHCVVASHDDLYCPTGHAIHDVLVVPSRTYPATHPQSVVSSWFVTSVPNVVVLPGHVSLHDEKLPKTVLIVLSGQTAQLPLERKVPGAHVLEQIVEPGEETVPAGHAKHSAITPLPGATLYVLTGHADYNRFVVIDVSEMVHGSSILNRLTSTCVEPTSVESCSTHAHG